MTSARLGMKQSINAALFVIGMAGLNGMVIVAPNALQGLAPLLGKTGIKQTDYSKLLKELRRQGLVDITKYKDQVCYTITPAGAYRLQAVIIDNLAIPSPAKWDKKWRLVAFDIPNGKSRSRKKFVIKLQDLGFTMLQKSLWVHPFPCFEQVEHIAGHYNVLRYCSLMEVGRLDEIATKKLLRSYPGLIKS